MTRTLLTFFALSTILASSWAAESSDTSELTLAEFKRMPGVKVFLNTDNTAITTVTVKLREGANYLGLDFHALGALDIRADIVVRDSDKNLIAEMTVPIRSPMKLNTGFSVIEFRVDSKLLPNCILLFHVQPQRGGQAISVSLNPGSSGK